MRKSSDATPVVVAGATLSLIVAALAVATSGECLTCAPQDIGWSLVLGAGVTGTGMLLYSAGSRHVPAAELVLLSNVEVMLAPFWVWLLLAEPMGPHTLIGGALILVAVTGNGLLTLGARAKADAVA
jgi:drug/metabolite transporter, DME family